MTKYGLAVADFHCGHLVGLTPPEYQIKFLRESITKRNKWYKISASLWVKFIEILKGLPPLDFLMINGDMIEGKGTNTGGTELVTADMLEQCDMAKSVIKNIRNYGKRNMVIVATYGTPYHTSTEGDEWENIIKEEAFIDKIGAHEWLDVNGVVFDIKHHIGSSSIPHGRHTAIAKEAIWNELWALTKMQPRADIIIRSHVHYFQFCGTSGKLCLTTPALQGMGSKFGAKKCSGLVDWGAILFEIKDKNDYNWYPFIHTLETQKASALKI